MTRTPAAVLWDFDGTLIDSEPLWQRTHAKIAADHGSTWTEHNAADVMGAAWPVAAEYMLNMIGRTDQPIEYVIDRWLVEMPALLRQEAIWMPGARELLAEVVGRGIPCGLVTASFRPIVEPALSGLPPQTFQVVVTGDAVTHGKPHPEPYLTAARALGVDPADCLVIEDSNAGSRSGNDAGAVVLATSGEPIEPHPRRVIVDGLAGMTWDGLCATVEHAWER